MTSDLISMTGRAADPERESEPPKNVSTLSKVQRNYISARSVVGRRGTPDKRLLTPAAAAVVHGICAVRSLSTSADLRSPVEMQFSASQGEHTRKQLKGAYRPSPACQLTTTVMGKFAGPETVLLTRNDWPSEPAS
jgi:hypothetical protein